MKSVSRICLLLLPLALGLALAAILSPARASAEELYGLAMTGKAKYGPGDAHLSYVNPQAPKGGTISQAAVGTFDTLNPFSIKGNAAQGLNMVTDRLMGRVWDEPFTLYPLIAQSAEVPQDRSSLTVHINPKARFHDGSPITADDVIFSFETLRDQGRPNMRRVYKLAESVKKPDDRTVLFKFAKGSDRETVMIFAMMPVLSKAWWAGRTFDSAVLEAPLSNGPYRVAEVDPGRRIVYERVPDYWAADLLVNKGENNADRIVYEYFRDDSVAFEAFKKGSLDLRREWDAGKWARAYDFPAARDGRVTLAEIPHGRPERVNAFIFNTRRPPFDDIRVREALNLLFDFDWVNASLFRGEYRRIESYFPNSELAAKGLPGPLELKILEPFKDALTPDVFGPAYANPPAASQEERRENLRKADLLLREAGWSVENGTRVKDGHPFKFEIVLGSSDDEKAALAFSRSLGKMGIEAGVRLLDSSQFLSRLGNYDFDMTLYFWLSSLSPGTEQYLYWSCEAANQKSRWNYAGICNPAIDAISRRIASAGSREELVASVRALDRVLMAQRAIVPLGYAGRDFAAYWNKIRRPETTPVYGMATESWWVEPDAAKGGSEGSERQTKEH